jgi:hypothetical protein
MLNKKTIFIAAAGVAASVLLFKGIRKVAGTVKEKLASVSSGEDLEDLADSQDDTREDGCQMEACDCQMEACDCEAVRGECES